MSEMSVALLAARRERGMSTDDVGRRIGVPSFMVEAYENGAREPTEYYLRLFRFHVGHVFVPYKADDDTSRKS